MLPPLLPEPKRARALPGRFRLRAGVPVVLAPDADDADFATARALCDAVRERCGVRLAVETHARSGDLGPRVELARTRPARAGAQREAYRLAVSPQRVALQSAGAAGLRYGVETLAQLVDRRGVIPACRVTDAPDLALRGILLDVSRGKVPTPASARALVDLCVRLRLNALLLYTEHSFAFRRHPQIGAGSSPFRAEEIRELDAYAAARHVELIPCLQSLGHMERVLSLPRYAPLAETELGWTLAPSDPRSYTLLRDLYDEYLPNFRSRLFHANCDEPWDLGRGRSRARAERIGRGGLFLEHVRRVKALARAHGKRTLIWADVVHQHAELASQIDRELLLLDWDYEAGCDVDRVRVFRRRGLEFAVCPGTSSWNALFPRVANSLANIERWAAAARRHGARGLVCTDWGDHGHYNLLGNSLLAYAWSAQQAWSGSADPRRFDRALGNALFGVASGDAARCFRELGAVHEAGFEVFNASPLQFLFFDDLDRAFFLQGARPAPLRRSLARLRGARARLVRAAPAFGCEPLVHAELLYAAEASVFACEKALAAGIWLAWRAGRRRLDARSRRALARRLRALATAQAGLARRLRRLWLTRSRPSDFSKTQRRLARSMRSLRAAARALERGVAPPPPPPADYSPGAVLRAVREAVRAPRRRAAR